MAKRAKAKTSKPGQKPVVQNTKKQQEAAAAAAAPRAVISENKLKQLLAAGRKTKESVAELTGTFAQRVAQAVENDHLDKKAFGMIRSLDRMEPEKLALTIENFEHMLEASGLRKRADDVISMRFGPGQEQAAEDDEEDEDEGDADASQARTIPPADAANVRSFPRPTAVGQD